jgi:hypothetical protein
MKQIEKKAIVSFVSGKGISRIIIHTDIYIHEREGKRC